MCFRTSNFRIQKVWKQFNKNVVPKCHLMNVQTFLGKMWKKLCKLFFCSCVKFLQSFCTFQIYTAFSDYVKIPSDQIYVLRLILIDFVASMQRCITITCTFAWSFDEEVFVHGGADVDLYLVSTFCTDSPLAIRRYKYKHYYSIIRRW